MSPLAALLAVICALVAACHQHVTVTLAGQAYGTSLGVLILAAVIAVAAAAVAITVRSCLNGRSSPYPRRVAA